MNTTTTRTLAVCAAGVFTVSAFAGRPAANGEATKLLRTPTVSATQIAFAYANNIWTVDRAGGIGAPAHELPGTDRRTRTSRPTASGSRSAREYAGNIDVYVVPAEGGEPKRLTWHPGADIVQGWTPDGKSIVFASSRATAAPSGAPRFWTVPVEGGVEEPMPLPRALPGQDLARRHARRLSHEQLVGRGAPQLSRRPEPSDLDRRSQDVRPRVAAVDRFEGHGSGVGRRHRLLPLRPRRRRERLVVRHEDEEARAGHEVHRLRREDARRRRRRASCSSRPATSTSSIRRSGKRARREHHGRPATSRG